jgi:hypothetical protein
MEQALRELEKQGFQARTVSIAHLPELQEAIEGRHDRGEFSEEFYQERLTDFRFAPPRAPPGARARGGGAGPRPPPEPVRLSSRPSPNRKSRSSSASTASRSRS